MALDIISQPNKDMKLKIKKKNLNLNLNLKINDSMISEAKNGLPKINEKTFN